MIKDQKILITGPTSQVALPIARALAAHNKVYGLARFRDPADQQLLEGFGIGCIRADLADGALDAIPDDFDYVLHFAIAKSDFEYDLRANAEGTGRLMDHCRRTRGWLQCSSAGVYEPAGHRPVKEDDPLGDNHRCIMPTYSICKIAAETMARFGARQWGIPTVIARLSVPYGANGGWPALHLKAMLKGHPVPVHSNQPNVYNPIHEDDYVEMVPKLLAVAAVPAITVNWGGEPASIEQWCEYMARLAGVEAKFFPTDQTLASLEIDLTRMHQLIGPARIGWQEGMRRMIRARFPKIPLPEGP